MVHPCLAGSLHNGSFLEMMEVGGGDLVLLRQIGTGMDVLESRAPAVTTPVLPASTAAPGLHRLLQGRGRSHASPYGQVDGSQLVQALLNHSTQAPAQPQFVGWLPLMLW